ncbi:MFS transporter [Alkalihalobacillus sp. TS-13]|uniref:MFS transporter n=1 Tax=Alkalihalobacillus sp. TS-13 TaxID=2842455 RepID=UPI001C877A95|nr:MFS transporter [Alkalihalobacillus sp. TS-13]
MSIPLLFPPSIGRPVYAILFIVVALGATLYNIFFLSLHYDYVPQGKDGGRYVGKRSTFQRLAGVGVLGITAIAFQFASSDRTAYLILVLIGLALFIVDMFFQWKMPDLPLKPSGETDIRGMISVPFRDRYFRRSLTYLSVMLLIQIAATSMFGYVITNILGLEPLSIWLVLVQLLSMAGGFQVWGHLSTLHHARSLWSPVHFCMGITCLSWALLAFLSPVVVLVWVHLLFGFTVGGFALLAKLFVIEEAPHSERPAYFGAFSLVTGILGFCGAPIGGALFSLNGPKWVQEWGIFAMIGLVLMLLALLVGRSILHHSMGGKHRPANLNNPITVSYLIRNNQV